MINIQKYFLKLLGFSERDVARLMHLILKRAPIFVYGQNHREIDKFTKALLLFVPFRKKIQYGLDFLYPSELDLLYEEENADTNVQRCVIYCLSEHFNENLMDFKNFTGWIISGNKLKKDFQDYLTILHKNVGIVNISPYSSKLYVVDSIDDKELDLEYNILKKVFIDARIITERLIRVIDKRIEKKSTFFEEITNFEDVYKSISQDLLEEEILKFVHAAKRALILMTRLKILKEVGGINFKISNKTIMSAIGYNTISLKTILRFINYEWNIDVSDIITNKKTQIIGDWVESLWV